MRVVIQRVSNASVSVDGVIRGAIGKGLCVLVGIGADDTEKDSQQLYLVKPVKMLIVTESKRSSLCDCLTLPMENLGNLA